jgi:hypothetical protein
LITTAYFVLIVPAAFFYCGRLFRGYYRYRPVPPRSYVRGMSAIWVSLAIGTVLAHAGCFVTRTHLPNVLIALVGNVFLLVLWPKGNAMAPPRADPEDTGAYQEPR